MPLSQLMEALGESEQLFGFEQQTKKDPPDPCVWRVRFRPSPYIESPNLFLGHKDCPEPEGCNPDPHHSCVNPESQLIDRLHSCEEYEHQHTDTRKSKS